MDKVAVYVWFLFSYGNEDNVGIRELLTLLFFWQSGSLNFIRLGQLITIKAWLIDWSVNLLIFKNFEFFEGWAESSWQSTVNMNIFQGCVSKKSYENVDLNYLFIGKCHGYHQHGQKLIPGIPVLHGRKSKCPEMIAFDGTNYFRSHLLQIYV